MSREAVCELFDNWERVWNERQLDLLPDCVAPVYIRNEEAGRRSVSPQQYADELATLQKNRPGLRIGVFDHEITDDSAWFRFSMTWNDAQTNEAHIRSGFQQYRIADGKLAETWVAFLAAGGTWTDTPPQDRWTVKRPRK